MSAQAADFNGDFSGAVYVYDEILAAADESLDAPSP